LGYGGFAAQRVLQADSTSLGRPEHRSTVMVLPGTSATPLKSSLNGVALTVAPLSHFLGWPTPDLELSFLNTAGAPLPRSGQ
jgi:hypothetical protein